MKVQEIVDKYHINQSKLSVLITSGELPAKKVRRDDGLPGNVFYYEIEEDDVKRLISNQVIRELVCPTCGKRFTSTNKRVKYCSHDCARLARNRQKRDNYKTQPEKKSTNVKPLLEAKVDEFTQSLTLAQQINIVHEMHLDINEYLKNPTKWVRIYYNKK